MLGREDLLLGQTKLAFASRVQGVLNTAAVPHYGEDGRTRASPVHSREAG